MCRCGYRDGVYTYSLLLHELAVGAVVDDILSEDGSSQNTIDLFSIDVLLLAVQDELVSLWANEDGGLLSEEYEGKDIAKLFKVGLVSGQWN